MLLLSVKLLDSICNPPPSGATFAVTVQFDMVKLLINEAMAPPLAPEVFPLKVLPLIWERESTPAMAPPLAFA